MTTAALTLVLSDETDTTSSQTVTVAGTGAHDITLGYGTDTVTSTSTGDVTVVATAGTNTITTGAGADDITLGTGVDTVTSAGGIDTISSLAANLVSTDTITGGDGVDILSITDASTVSGTASGTTAITDSDFTNITTVETLTLSANADTVTLGAASMAAGIVTVNPAAGVNAVTVGAGHTSALTVNLTTGTDTIVGSASAAALTIAVADIDEIAATDTLTGGSGSSDSLVFTGSATAVTAAEMANVTGFETLSTLTDAAIEITMSDNNVIAGGSMTVNGATNTSAVVDFDGSAETDGSYTITTLGTGAHIITLGNGSDTYTSTNTAGINTVTATGGNNTITTAAGADIITLGSGTDTVTAGAGANVIVSASNNLNLNDTIAGGTDTDTLQLSTDGSVVIDADFTNVTSVETLTMNAADKNLTATLGTLAAATGIVTVTDTDTSADGTLSLTLAAGFTNNVSVTLADDAAIKTVDATNYTKVLTVNAADTALNTSANVITGGTGSSDVLKVTGSAATITTGIASMTAVEKITTVGNGGVIMVLANANIASGETLTIDGTSMAASNVLSVNASAETNGTVAINVSVAVDSDHVATLGAGNDTFTGTLGTGVQTVTATGGNNTIITGTGVDIINVGTGQDTVTVNAGTANTINFTLSTHLVANSVTVTDWTKAKGIITFDLADLNAGADLQNLGQASDAVAAADSGIDIITGPVDLADSTNNDIILIADLTTAISSSSELEDALEYGGALQVTANAALAVGDRFLVAYDDNVSTYVAMVTTNSVIAADQYIGAGNLTAVTLVKLTGVTEASVGIAAGDIDLE
jgi:hypothetical protein